jgi:hypothetical protein
VGGFGLADGRAVSAALALRLRAPITPLFGLYARGGLERTWVRSERMDLAGDGYLLGVGLDLAPPVLPVALWVELGHASTTLSGDGAAYGGTIQTAMIGVRVDL